MNGRILRHKKGDHKGRLLVSRGEPILARIEFDDQIGFHFYRIGDFVQRRYADEGHFVIAIGADIFWNVAFGQALCFDNQSHFLGLVTQRDHRTDVNVTAGDVALYAVNADVTVADELTRSEDCGNEFRAIDDHVQTAFQQTDKVLRGIALHPVGFLISTLELLFGDVAVIALQLLLGAQLRSVIGNLAFAALTVLAWAVFALVDGGLRAPQMFSPIRRSSLYFELLRFVINVSFNLHTGRLPPRFMDPEPHHSADNGMRPLLHRACRANCEGAPLAGGAGKSQACLHAPGRLGRVACPNTGHRRRALCQTMDDVRAGVDALDAEDRAPACRTLRLHARCRPDQAEPRCRAG